MKAPNCAAVSVALLKVCPMLALLALFCVVCWGQEQTQAAPTGQNATETAHVHPAPDSTSESSPTEPQGFIQHLYRAFHEVQNWLALGLALLLGRFGGKLATHFRCPMVVGYLVVGVILGRSVLNIISQDSTQALELVTDLGLGLVAFMIGTELSHSLIRKLGTGLIVITIMESLGAFCLVALLVWILSNWLLPAAGLAVAGALVFGAMAPASAPAGTVAVIQEYHAKGPLTKLLLAVVGLDDALAIMIFAFATAAAKMLLSPGQTTLLSLIQGPSLEILGGILVGLVVGLFLRIILGRLRSPGDTLTLTLGAILLTTGIANTLHLSLILANLAVGAVLANLSPRATDRSYHAVEQIVQPVYVLFFVVAGAHLDLRLLAQLSLLGPVYIVARSLGLIGGAYVGASLAHSEPLIRRYLGLGILSQAGVAIGLALTVANDFAGTQYGLLGRQLAQLTINTIAATTIIFEIIGPITTKIALTRAGEIGHAETDSGDH